jgi:hypothetical protein
MGSTPSIDEGPVGTIDESIRIALDEAFRERIRSATDVGVGIALDEAFVEGIKSTTDVRIRIALEDAIRGAIDARRIHRIDDGLSQTKVDRRLADAMDGSGTELIGRQ